MADDNRWRDDDRPRRRSDDRDRYGDDRGRDRDYGGRQDRDWERAYMSYDEGRARGRRGEGGGYENRSGGGYEGRSGGGYESRSGGGHDYYGGYAPGGPMGGLGRGGSDESYRDRDHGGLGWGGERDRDRGAGYEQGGFRGERSGGYGYGGEARRDSGGDRRGDDDRGFLDRASDEVSSWFGDRDAERRREMDAAREGRHRGRGPKGYTRSDDRIREDVSDRLSDDPVVDASNVEVSVSGAEVTLSGTVESRDERRRAEDCAEAVSGVSYVQNNLRVQKSGASRQTEGGQSGTVAGRDNPDQVPPVDPSRH